MPKQVAAPAVAAAAAAHRILGRHHRATDVPHLFRTILQWCGVRARRPYRTTVAKCHCDQPRKRCRPCYRTSCEDAAVRPWKCVNCPRPPPPRANQRQFHHWQQQCPQQQCRRRRGSVAMQPQVSHSMPCKVYWYDPLPSLSIHSIGTCTKRVRRAWMWIEGRPLDVSNMRHDGMWPRTVDRRHANFSGLLLRNWECR